MEIQRTDYVPRNDAASYLQLSLDIAHTGDYARILPTQTPGVSPGPTAYFPPGYPFFLAAIDLIAGSTDAGSGTVHRARLAQSLLGTATVALVGLVAFEVFGVDAALAALALAALYPVLIALGGTLRAENLLVALALGAVWTTLRARRSRHHLRWVALSGLFTGSAILTHENGAVLLIALVPAVWRKHPRWSLRALAAPGTLLLVTALVIAPWTVRNAVEFHRFIPVSDETGWTLAGTYNAVSAANRSMPYAWLPPYEVPADAGLLRSAPHLSEPVFEDRLLSRALAYIGNHPLAPAEVGYYNLRRLFELGGSAAWKEGARAVGIPAGFAQVGVVCFWLIAALAVLGALTSTARRAPRWLWAVPTLFALSVIFVNAQTPRFRLPIDPFVIMLAACTLVTPLRSRAVRRRPLIPTLAGRGGRPRTLDVTEHLP